jgi:hypothetical protein
MQVIRVFERAPDIVKTFEALGPYLRSVDFDTIRGWLPRRRIRTRWSLVIGAFGAGMLVGAGAAFMAAPKRGAELRSELKSKLDTVAQRTRERLQERRAAARDEQPADIKAEPRPQWNAE